MAGKKDIVEQALKMVMGEGSDAAKAGIRAYHGTPQPTENLIDLFHGTNPEAFDAITSSGDIFGSSRFSPRRDVAETFAHNVGGNANTVVKVKAPASSLMVDLDLPAAKLLTPDEAAAYLDKPDWTILDFIENGYSVGVPDTSVLSIERASGGSIREGYGPGGWVDDVVKMAGKVISGEGEKAVGITPGTFPGKKLPRVDALANNVDKFVYHSGLAENVPDMKYGIDPQIGPWVRENLESDVDEEHLSEILENAVPVAWWSKQPDWAVVKVARKLNKTVDQVTPEDLVAHGHVAMIPKKDPEAEHLYWMGEEGLNNGPYSEIEDITGKKVKAYNTDLYSNNYGPEGVERNEYVTTRALEPYLHLTGNELLDFLRKTGAYDKAYGGRARGGNNSISGALNVARGLNGGE